METLFQLSYSPVVFLSGWWRFVGLDVWCFEFVFVEFGEHVVEAGGGELSEFGEQCFEAAFEVGEFVDECVEGGVVVVWGFPDGGVECGGVVAVVGGPLVGVLEGVETGAGVAGGFGVFDGGVAAVGVRVDGVAVHVV